MEWKTIPSWPDYEASDHGDIRRKTAGKGARKGHILKQFRHRSGYNKSRPYYPAVNVSSGNKRSRQLVHGLIAEAFHGRRPKGHVVNHKDGDTWNNRAENLEYLTHSENTRHAYRVLGRTVNRGETLSRANLTEADVREMRNRVAEGEPRKAVAASYGISVPQVCRIVNHQSWAHVQ